MRFAAAISGIAKGGVRLALVGIEAQDRDEAIVEAHRLANRESFFGYAVEVWPADRLPGDGQAVTYRTISRGEKTWKEKTANPRAKNGR